MLQEGLFNAFATNSLLLDFDVCFASVSFLQKHSQVSNIVNIDLLMTATGLGLKSDGLFPIDHKADNILKGELSCDELKNWSKNSGNVKEFCLSYVVYK